MRLGALLHRAGDVDEEDDPAPTHADELAGIAHGLAKHPPRIGPRAAARGTPSVPAPPRHARRQVASEAAQRLVLAAGGEAARRKPLGAGRLGAGFMRVFTEDRLRPAGRIVGGARRLLVARLRLQSWDQRAE